MNVSKSSRAKNGDDPSSHNAPPLLLSLRFSIQFFFVVGGGESIWLSTESAECRAKVANS